MSSSKLHQIACLLVLVFFAVGVLSAGVPIGTGQISEDATLLSYRAFSALAQVYRAGGEADDLVSRLNSAISLLEESRMRRSTGDETVALALEEQARSMIEQVVAEVPAAQQRAQSQSLTKTIIVVASIPPSILLSTLVFIVALNVWRGYERSKLFEMRIVEKNTED